MLRSCEVFLGQDVLRKFIALSSSLVNICFRRLGFERVLSYQMVN